MTPEQLSDFHKLAEDAIAKSVKQHQIAINNLTEEQVCQVFKEAIACGDISMHVVVPERPGQIQQGAMYIPFAEKQRLESRIKELERALEAAERSAAEALRENTMLRALLPKLKAPCAYCGETEIGKCKLGFPGCSQADDLMCGEDETFKRVVTERDQLKSQLADEHHKLEQAEKSAAPIRDHRRGQKGEEIMTKTTKTVIYHSADFDGIFCREIARKFLGNENVEYIGWNYGDPLIPYPDEGVVYVLDLSPDCFTHGPQRTASSLIWIDHHKTSIEKWPKEILGYRIDGVAACRLTWQWFVSEQASWGLPCKEDYIYRVIDEPLSVRLAGEYDIWDKRDPSAETFQYGLRVVGQDDLDWSELLSQGTCYVTESILLPGKFAQKYAQDQDASICQSRTWVMEWEGLKFLCVNSARFNSLFFAAKDVPETGHDALLGFCFNGKLWTVSLYHAKHNTGIDLSAIAKKHGGGGHRGACGFTCKTPPFIKYP